MATLNEYQQKIQDLLTELANYGSSDREVESQLIFDSERDHYQLAHVGWRNKRRIYLSSARGHPIYRAVNGSQSWYNSCTA